MRKYYWTFGIQGKVTDPHWVSVKLCCMYYIPESVYLRYHLSEDYFEIVANLFYIFIRNKPPQMAIVKEVYLFKGEMEEV